MKQIIQGNGINRKAFEFHGKTGDFFNLWIVNIFLTMFTFGIYSPWAKVRTRRYFYNNTFIMNTPLDYLADPVKILKGRIIALVVLMLYSFAVMLSPVLNTLLTFGLIAIIPWIINKTITFNLYNTSYRNIRFNFNGRYLKALWIFIGLGFISILTVGLAYPYFEQQRKKFIFDNSTYGITPFEMQAGPSQFYGIYLRAFFAVLGILLLQSGVMFFQSQFDPSANGADNNAQISKIVILYSIFITIPFLLAVYAYISTSITNLVINNTVLNNHTFACKLTTGNILRLYFFNTFGIILSFGLLIPWAMIRMADYKLSCMAIYPQTDFDEFVAAEARNTEAIGEEMGDAFDVDIGL